MFLEEPTQQQLILSTRYALYNSDRAIGEYVETACGIKVLTGISEGLQVSEALHFRFLGNG